MPRLVTRQTVCHGFDFDNGEMVPRTYTIPGFYKSERHALNRIRQEHVNFALEAMTRVRLVYEMTDDEFIQKATLISSEEI